MTAARGPGPALEELWVYDRAAQYAYLARLARDCQQETAVLYRNNESALPVLDLLDRQGIALPVPADGRNLFHPPGGPGYGGLFHLCGQPGGWGVLSADVLQAAGGDHQGRRAMGGSDGRGGGEPAGCAVPVSRPVPVEQGQCRALSVHFARLREERGTGPWTGSATPWGMGST